MIRNFEESRPEWMDVAETASPELERDLANLESLNRRFGAHKLVLDYLTPVLERRQPLRVLDLGTGAADIPRVLVRRARELGCPIIITAIDRQQPTLDIAEKFSADFPEIRFQRADFLTFSEGSLYDIVLCNLVLHHLDETDVIRLLRRCRELTKGAVLVTDLRRSRLAQTAIFAVTQLVYREPMTRHDARLSAERAFSFPELRKLATASGWWGFRHKRTPFFRQALWLDMAARKR
ncbi:MAG: methyltransferase domain-containing protein [Chthoniobacterales bacterium]